MTECYESCEDMKLALEIGENIRQEYNKLLDSYNKLKEDQKEVWKWVEYYEECAECAETAIAEEFEQMRNMPEELRELLLLDRGFKLAAQRWIETIPEVRKRYKEFFEKAQNRMKPPSIGENIVAFPRR